jgi:hypothetical protein
MAEDDSDILSEAEATRLWERAAEAAKAAEIAKATAAAARGTLPAVRDGIDAPGGYALSHVREAALEAGIAPEFVEAALADLRTERALPATTSGGAFARRFLDDPPDTLTARRVIAAAPREVLAAMEALFVSEPYHLVLVDQRGDPLAGGVMLFDIHSTVSPFNPGFGYQMRDSGVRQLAIMLRPLDAEVPSCEVTIHGRLTSHRVSAGLGVLLSSIVGAVGFGVGAGVGLAVISLGVATAVGPVLAVGGFALAGAGGVKGFRALHRRSMRLGRQALEGLLGAIGGRAQGGWLGSR